MTTLTPAADPPTWHIPAESKEWVGPLTVAIGGTPTSSYKIAVLPASERPTAWEDPGADPDSLQDGLGVEVGAGTAHPLTPGVMYWIWVQIELGVSQPVLERVAVIAAT